jgi:hypothetical protein
LEEKDNFLTPFPDFTRPIPAHWICLFIPGYNEKQTHTMESVKVYELEKAFYLCDLGHIVAPF